MKSREVIARLKKDGWLLVHIRGSHHHFKHPEKPGRVTVPHPKKGYTKGHAAQHFSSSWLAVATEVIYALSGCNPQRF